MVEDVMHLPDQSEAVGAIQEVGATLSRFMQEDQANFSYILDMSEHDYYTATHMVNVGVGCGMLVAELHPGDHDLARLVIQGGLLHDLGKRGIPAEILNKDDELTPAEWTQVRQHPSIGYDELLKRGDVDPVVLEMTRDHHERLNGTGYPRGLAGAEVTFAARLCAAVDVFDAITAARPYRGPTPATEVLESLSADSGTLYDEQIVAAWRTLVERLLIEDPARVRNEGRGAGTSRRGRNKKASGVTLAASVIQAASATEFPERAEPGPGGERSQYPRKACDHEVSASFIRQMKDYAVPVGRPFRVCIKNISRTGVCIETPWPLSLNDLLSVELPGTEDPVRRRIRIVRVRLSPEGQWIAGACFIAQENTGHSKAA